MMKRFMGSLILFFTFIVMAGISLAASDPNDAEGSKEHPLFTRMPGYYIETYDDKEFDSVQMPSGANEKTVTVEGHCVRIQYRANDYDKKASGVQILRNYSNAIQKIGGKVIYQFDRNETLQLIKNSVETWTLVETGDAWYKLTIVEKQAMKQDVVADAASLASSLKETGKVALYGIYFDTGKSEVKPESEPSLKEIAKLLQTDPKLKLYVVGHTDNAGTFDYNIKLSKDRADAVVKALVTRYGITASRLQSFGAGPVAPVESNQTEEGRAKNRRVELVAQ
ncbi:MAG TPA: OmpA family protein [Bacillota bacterium]|nr:OmpA family protein [Bacillota bacterium]